jgi:hypothetical protein
VTNEWFVLNNVQLNDHVDIKMKLFNMMISGLEDLDVIQDIQKNENPLLNLIYFLHTRNMRKEGVSTAILTHISNIVNSQISNDSTLTMDIIVLGPVIHYARQSLNMLLSLITKGLDSRIEVGSSFIKAVCATMSYL